MKRIQRKRTKGYKMPENTKYVGRPTKWGNPFRLNKDGFIEYYSAKLSDWWMWSATPGFETADAIVLYEKWIKGELKKYKVLPIPPELDELQGKNLACFCPLDSACHVDVLLKQLSK